jgi:hypothetical protein
VLDESTIETDSLEPLDRNNQDPESEDSIVVNSLLTVKCNKGRSRKYVNVTLFLQDDIDYETSR